MQKEYEINYHSLEKDYWWFVSRREIIKKIISKYSKMSKILEIGCSSGQLIKELNLQNYNSVWGIDISSKAINECKQKQIDKVFVLDCNNLKINKKFDIIIASDVLEHIKNDNEIITIWKNALKKDGIIICFVPALNILWSEHDVINKHYRRYNKKKFKKLFEDLDFKILKISYWNFFLFFPILLFRLIKNNSQKTKPNGDLFKLNNFSNFFLKKILKFENKLLTKINLPIGVSLFLIAKK